MKSGFIKAVLLPAIVIAVSVALIAVFPHLPTRMQGCDVSDQDLHSISEATKAEIQALDEDVDIYYLTQKGQEVFNTEYILNLVKDESDRITLHVLDTQTDLLEIAELTGSRKADDNTVIVASEDRTYLMNYGTYYKSGVFYLEDYIVKGLEFVTGKISYKACFSEGLGEDAVPEAVARRLNMNGYTVLSTSLDSIPDDCDVLIINNPRKAADEEETAGLNAYLESGKNVLLIGAELPDGILSVANDFGVGDTLGTVYETDEERIADGGKYRIIPKLNQSCDERLLKGVTECVLENARAIGINEDEENKISAIIETADSSRISGKDKGPYIVGVLSEKAEQRSSMIRFSFDTLVSEELIEETGGSSLSLFINSVDYLRKNPDIAGANAKKISNQRLSFDEHTGQIFKVIIFVIPATVMLVGIAVSIKRRRR